MNRCWAEVKFLKKLWCAKDNQHWFRWQCRLRNSWQYIKYIRPVNGNFRTRKSVALGDWHLSKPDKAFGKMLCIILNCIRQCLVLLEQECMCSRDSSQMSSGIWIPMSFSQLSLYLLDEGEDNVCSLLYILEINLSLYGGIVKHSSNIDCGCVSKSGINLLYIVSNL